MHNFGRKRLHIAEYQETRSLLEGWDYTMCSLGGLDETRLLGILQNLAKCGTKEIVVNSNMT